MAHSVDFQHGTQAPKSLMVATIVNHCFCYIAANQGTGVSNKGAEHAGTSWKLSAKAKRADLRRHTVSSGVDFNMVGHCSKDLSYISLQYFAAWHFFALTNDVRKLPSTWWRMDV